MTEKQQEEIDLLKELIADSSIANDEREIYQKALTTLLSRSGSEEPKVAKKMMPKKEKATPKTKATKKPKANKPTQLPSDVEAMKKQIKERTGKTEAECEDIISQYRMLRNKAKVNGAKRIAKLKGSDDLIAGTNVITPVAQIEKDAEIVKAKIEKQVEQIENKAEREVVKKDKTKDEVKVAVEKKVVKELAKLSDDMLSKSTTFVKNIQTELKKVDKTEAKNFLLGLRNEIDALLSKFGDGGTTEIYNIAEMNSSSSSVNPSKFARGGGVNANNNAVRVKALIKSLDNTPYSIGLAILRERLLTYTQNDLKIIEKNPSTFDNPIISSGMYKAYFNLVIEELKFDYEDGGSVDDGKFAMGGGVGMNKSYNNPENAIHVLHIDNQNWYLEKIDSTHFYMSNDPNFRGMAHHIGQHKGEIYYDEIKQWLKDTQYAKGGGVSKKEMKIVTLEDGKKYREITYFRKNKDGVSEPYNEYEEVKAIKNKMADGGLIGNQKRIDLNENGKIDAEDFKLLRSSMNGAFRNEQKYVNKSQSYETRYAKSRPSRTGYNVKKKLARGGFVGKAELVWRKLSSSDKMNFLNENFTPEISERSQYTLVGKSYNFLPKKVKIVLASKYANVEEYAMGGGIEDSPSIYVADLEAYNNGRLNGEWLKLTDYNNADELMEAIQVLLDKWGVEEYAIHDTEYIPSNLSSEYMGQKDFEQLYEMIDLANEYNLPLEVVQDIVSQYDASAVEEYQGKYDNAIDFAEQLVDETGIESFIDFQQYLDISNTDRRLLANEFADSYVDDIKNEDGGNRIIEEAGLDVSEYEEADSNRQDEMLDEAVEIVREEYYNTWYDGLDYPYYFLVEEQGLFSADDFAKADFIRIDYDKLADALEQDYTFIYDSNNDLYVFNIR